MDASSTANTGSSCVSFLLLFAEVALIVEVTEEDHEGDAVTKHEQVHGVWEVALSEQVVARVQEEQRELHLERETSHQLIRKHSFLRLAALLAQCRGRSPAAA